MRYLVLLVLMGWLTTGSAAERILDLAQPHEAIGQSVDWFEDPAGSLRLSDILALPAARFIPLGQPVASHTFTRSTFWYRFKVENRQAVTVSRIIWFAQAWLDTVNVAVVSPHGETSWALGGNGQPFSQRAIAYPLLNDRLSFEPGRSVVYVQVKTPDPFIVSINLMDEPSFLRAQVIDAALIGLVYGAIFSMLLYNLLLYIGIRERYQLFYVFYLGTFLLMNAGYNNYTFPLLFADNPQGQDWMQSGAIFLFLYSGLLFARSFLDLLQSHPRLYRLTTALLYGVLVLALVTPWWGYRVHVELSIILSSLISFYAFAIGLYSWLRGNRSARFFLLGSMSGLVGTMVTAFTVMAFLPFHYITYKALDFGLMVDCILMSLALADRLKLAREEQFRAELDSKTDSLTGLNNRRAYQEIGHREEQRLQQHPGELAAIVLDINRFKQINDTYGHAAGDLVLQQVATVIRRYIRTGDHVFRMGGDEFLILLPDTDEVLARVLADRLRRAIAIHPVIDQGLDLPISVSVGVGQYRAGELSLDGLLKRTDDAMYRDKRGAVRLA
jgi:two-component system, sensor histidine kinase LadS